MESCYFRVIILAVLVIQVKPVKAISCADTSIGVENSHIFPDSRFSSSSNFDSRFLPPKARLYSTHGWAPKTNTNPNNYLQIDLGATFRICAVATQGSGDKREWITRYKIMLSLDNIKWTTYQEDGNDKEFKGNSNQNSLVKNTINKPQAKYFRIIPMDYVACRTFRVGIFGYQGDCDQTIGVENPMIIPDDHFTAIDIYSSHYVPSHARFNSYAAWEPKTNTNPNDYLQVDLGISYVICAIATQGNGRTEEWTTEFKISILTDNSKWEYYKENGILKLFPGNIDQNIIQSYPIKNLLLRSIRFFPTKYHNHKAVRVGLIGRLKASDKNPLGMESRAIPDNHISASSSSQSASNARLRSASSWCASSSDSSPYLQIDLDSDHVISVVATQGNSADDQWVKSFQISISSQGNKWKEYKENGVVRTFYANYDRSTIVSHMLYRNPFTRYVRLLLKTYQGLPCLRMEIYGYELQSRSSISVGIPSNSLIPDYRFTATSYLDTRYFPYYGRLGGSKGWEAKTDDVANEYLQIDVGDVHQICQVSTQGSGFNDDEWITKYKIVYSMNGVSWTTYQEGGKDKVFKGNIDRKTVATNSMTKPFKAKFVRVIPISYHSHKTMRVGLRGATVACLSSLGVEDFKISDSQITSSTSSDTLHLAPRGRLYGKSAWCSLTASKSEYIQVDLGQVKTVSGIATQGDPKQFNWVTSYKVSYSFRNGVWYYYKEGQVTKIFTGNTDRNSIRVNWLLRPVAARHVRIYPHESHIGPCLRMDLYGCDFYSTPPKINLNVSSFILPSTKTSSRTLWCIIRGEVPDVQWLRSGKTIPGGTKPTLQVKFVSAEDVLSKFNCARQYVNTRTVICKAKYSCRVSYLDVMPSSTGIYEAVAPVTVFLNVPDAPAVSAVPYQRSIILSWSVADPTDDVGTITSFVIEFKNISSLKTITLGNSFSSYNLTYLRPYTNFTIRIKAVTKVGQGLWSSLKRVSTMTAVPDGVPTISNIVAVNSTSLRIDWQLTNSNKVNGPMTGFKISYKKEGGVNFTTNVDDIRTYTLTSLEKNTVYILTVSAQNNQYVGPPSSSRRKKTLEDAPDCSPVLKSVQSLSATSVFLIWSSLENQACANGVLRGYKVVYQLSANKSAPVEVAIVNQSVAITTVVSGLRESTEYVFQVLGFTIKDGPPSNALQTSPQPIGNLTILSNKMSSVFRAGWGDTVSMGCYATGAHPITYTWTRDGLPVVNTSSTRQFQNVLVVKPKTARDYGLYLCNVSNIKGESASYVISLQPLVSFDENTTQASSNLTFVLNKMTSIVRVVVGEKAVIGCYATGTPPIRYTWSKDSTSMSNLTVFGNTLVALPKNALDYGIYYCRASNIRQTISYPIKLVPASSTCNISNTNSDGDDKLKILTYKMTPLVRASLGDRVSIGCYATGSPPIMYNWTKDGYSLKISNTIKVLGNVLVIQPKTDKDFGSFVCGVYNKKEKATYSIHVQQMNLTVGSLEARKMNNVYQTAIVPFIIVLIILLIVLVLVILYLIRRHRRDRARLPREPYIVMGDIISNDTSQMSLSGNPKNDYETLLQQNSSPDIRDDTGYYESPNNIMDSRNSNV